jgi:hypothetical protein
MVPQSGWFLWVLMRARGGCGCRRSRHTQPCMGPAPSVPRSSCRISGLSSGPSCRQDTILLSGCCAGLGQGLSVQRVPLQLVRSGRSRCPVSLALSVDQNWGAGRASSPSRWQARVHRVDGCTPGLRGWRGKCDIPIAIALQDLSQVTISPVGIIWLTGRGGASALPPPFLSSFCQQRVGGWA